jgi:hypothetical protein
LLTQRIFCELERVTKTLIVPSDRGDMDEAVVTRLQHEGRDCERHSQQDRDPNELMSAATRPRN